MYINVSIDGPAGAGKSTIAKLAAKKLEFVYVDTGAMYRAMALACIRNNIKSDESEKVIDICMKADVSIEYKNDEQHVLLNGENVNDYIRTEEVSQMTSPVSAYPELRKKLLDLQRDLANGNNVIMDGRDIGTNILPNADPKIYLTASVETRAKRRYLELVQKGSDCTLENIEKEIEERDYRDMHRDCAPLKVPEDAVIIDSSDMSIDEVVNRIAELIKSVSKKGDK